MKYVIDKTYTFGAITDSGYTDISYHVSYNHNQVMELGRYFLENEIDNDEISCNFDIKDQLDQAEMKSIAQSLFEDCESEDKDIEDFYDNAWEILGLRYYYYCWSPELKRDCINYYNNHKEK